MPLRQRLFRIYWALERRLAPGLEYAQATYERRLFELVEGASHWLDLGCGRALLPRWRADAERQLLRKLKHLVGVDRDRSAVLENATLPCRVCADCSALPFANESFDLVTANMVVEHLDAPDTQFAEVHRVLCPGGRFLFHTPN